MANIDQVVSTRRAEGGAKPFYRFMSNVHFNGTEPAFFDPMQFPWVKTLEDNWTVIRDELLTFLASHEGRLEPYFNKSLFFPPLSWKVLTLVFWNMKMHENSRDCPRTMEILSAIPYLTAASVSVLEPNSEIHPHSGDTNAIMRLHLGLVIPDTLPNCGFKVANETRGWQEGKALIFCDAHVHSAWNRSNKRRFILILDVMRPEFADDMQQICSNVLGFISIQYLQQHFASMKRLSPTQYRSLHSALSKNFQTVLQDDCTHQQSHERTMKAVQAWQAETGVVILPT